MSLVALSSNRGRNPHPILKRDSSPFRTPALPFSHSRGGLSLSPHVHFPPTPGMSSTYPAHSPTTYDRKPIAVSPNVVQLPRRGERRLHSPSPHHLDSENETGDDRRGRCRGRGHARRRSISLDPDPADYYASVKGSYFHPRAYEACVPERADAPASRIDFAVPPPPPPLIRDLSPSDESDEPVLTPPGTASTAPASAIASVSASAVPRAMPLQLRMPEATKGRRSLKPAVAAEPAGTDAQPLPLVQPPPLSHRTKGRRVDSARVERREGQRSSFSPDRDEGCLGGF